MDFKQAQVVMTKVVDILEKSALDKYSLVATKGSEESGYAVYIGAFVGAVRKQEIYNIAEQHHLSITEDKEGIAIR